MIDLTGQVALVTGSSRGIGKACAIRFAEAGADVIVNYVTSRSDAEEVARAIQSLGRRCAVVKANVVWQEDVVSMIEFVKSHFGRLDILVSNAAGGGFRPVIASTPMNFEATMNTNVRALIFLVQAALPLLERTGARAKVIGISSHGSFRALPMYGLIGASKAALESLVRHLALEIGCRGVSLNVLLAGLVDTDSSREIPGFEEIAVKYNQRSMVGRALTARDVADAALFLASPLSDLVQGQTLIVDGGASIHA